LYGPPGIGKTSSILAIGKSLNFDIVSVNASDKRNIKSLRSIRNASIFSSLKESLDSKIIGQILLIDEVDGLSGTADRGGLKEIIDIINSTKVPLILTANNINPQKFKTLKKYCELREFLPPTTDEILTILHRITDRESITISDSTLRKLIELSLNDVRGSINSLQALASGKQEILDEDLSSITFRDTTVEIQEFFKTIFIEANGEKAYQQSRMLSDVDYSKLLLLLRDLSIRFVPIYNYDQLAQVYDILAKADVALTRAQKNRVWSQLAYFYYYITKELSQVITPKANFPSIPTWQFQVPSYWVTLSRQKRGRKIASKIGNSCNISQQDAINYYFPYLHFIFNHNTEMSANLAINFELFDVEPGKRKTKIIWNKEIDFFCKNKDLNRGIKRRIRELYPTIERIHEKEIDIETLQKIKEQLKIAKDHKLSEKREIEKKLPSKKSEQPKRKSRKKANKPVKREKNSEKTLSDFF
jgi:replication factor C large subunit